MSNLFINKGNSRKYAFSLLGVFGLSFLMGYAIFLFNEYKTHDSEYAGYDKQNIIDIRKSNPVKGFGLVTHNGKELTGNNFIGYWSFIFFGFTNCPDICPATLSQMSVLNKTMHNQRLMSDTRQFMFVSVDPERDSLKHLSEYVEYFNPDFIGITGEMNNIQRFEKQFGAFHKLGKPDMNGFYNVAHTSSIFLVNPDGKVALEISPPLDIDNVVKQLTNMAGDFNKKLS